MKFIIALFSFVMLAKCFIHKEGYDFEGPTVITTEMRLHNDLFRNGSGSSFPNLNGPVNVTFGLTLQSVVDIRESGEAIILSAYVRQVWMNKDLAWDPALYDGIKKINIRPEISWTPDIFIYANLEDDKNYNGLLSTMKTNIILSSSGSHFWHAPVTLKLGCTMNFRDYPFDSQVCPLQFGSFTYDMSKIVLHPESVDMESYAESTEWLFLSMDGTKQRKAYPGRTTPFSDVVYTLKVKRKPLNLLINLVIPNLMLAFLTILVFILPINAGERASFVLTILLALSWYMTSNVNTMPSSSEAIPFFSYFLGMVLFTVPFLLVCLCYSIGCHYAKSNIVQLPKWVRYCILGKLSVFFNLDTRRKEPKWRKQLRRIKELNVNALMDDEDELNEEINNSIDDFYPGKLWSHQDTFETAFTKDEEMGKLEHVFGEKTTRLLNHQLTVLMQNMEEDDDARWLQKQWRIIALTLDKLFMYTFLGILSTTTFSCIIRVTQIE